jgi:hypothetical protein
MRADFELAQRASNVEAVLRIAAVVMHFHLIRGDEGSEAIHKCGALAGLGAVMHVPGKLLRLEFRDHRHHRRDADAAGQQKMKSRFAARERETIDRRGNRNRLPFRDRMHSDGTAAPVRFLQDSNLVTMSLARVAAE